MDKSDEDSVTAGERKRRAQAEEAAARRGICIQLCQCCSKYWVWGAEERGR